MEQSQDTLKPLEQWLPYLRALAQTRVERRLQSKIDASDIVQLTMLEAHRGRSQFRGESDNELRGWLSRIMARNLADEVRKFRRGKRDAGLEQSWEAVLTDTSLRLESCLFASSTRPDHHAMRNEQLIALAAALDSLPDDQRLAITLHHLQGKTAAEIATEMARTEGAVAGLLRRGLQRLRELLQALNKD